MLVALIPASAAQYHGRCRRLATLPPGERKASPSALLRTSWPGQQRWLCGPTSTYVASTDCGRPERPPPHRCRACCVHAVDGEQYLAARFPEMDSARYAADFDEVKNVGAVNSATRTPAQTQLAQLFAAVTITGTNINVIWNNVVRDVTLGRHLTLLQSARLYALMNVATIDGLQTSQTGKFIYGLSAPGDSDPQRRHRSRSRHRWRRCLDTVARDSAVSDLPGQHGLHRCSCGARNRTWNRDRRLRIHGDVGRRRWQPAHPAVVHRIFAARAG